MLVKIKDGSELDLNPGDDVLISQERKVLVIGIADDGERFAYHHHSSAAQLGKYPDFRKSYNISPSYGDEMMFMTIPTKYIEGRVVESAKSANNSQERLAAWGADEYVPPPGAPFKYL